MFKQSISMGYHLNSSIAIQNSLSFPMNEPARRRQTFLLEIRKKNREAIRNNIREAVQAKNNSMDHPLISDVLADFMHCTHWELTQESEKICEIIEATPLTEMDDFEHEEFITDLYYLVHQNIITIPFGVKFKKNQSRYTATLVALTANCASDDELIYWKEYMDEEARDVLFYSIAVQDEVHERWITNPTLYDFLLKNLEWIESAAITFKDFLVLSQSITKKQIDQCLPYLDSAIKRQMQKESKIMTFLRTLTQIWIKLIQIYSKLSFHNDKVKEMINILKWVIRQDIEILVGNDILQDLNQLYQLIREDYIETNDGCETLLLRSIQCKEMNDESQHIYENEELFKNYLFRLFHNNWRAKQLNNRGFTYSPNFYAMLRTFNAFDQSSPYFMKLINLQPKI